MVILFQIRDVNAFGPVLKDAVCTNLSAAFISPGRWAYIEFRGEHRSHDGALSVTLTAKYNGKQTYIHPCSAWFIWLNASFFYLIRFFSGLTLRIHVIHIITSLIFITRILHMSNTHSSPPHPPIPPPHTHTCGVGVVLSLSFCPSVFIQFTESSCHLLNKNNLFICFSLFKSTHLWVNHVLSVVKLQLI